MGSEKDGLFFLCFACVCHGSLKLFVLKRRLDKRFQSGVMVDSRGRVNTSHLFSMMILGFSMM